MRNEGVPREHDWKGAWKDGGGGGGRRRRTSSLFLPQNPPPVRNNADDDKMCVLLAFLWVCFGLGHTCV